MAQAKKNIARWVLQGVCVLGILLGFGLLLAAIATSLGVLSGDGENFALICFGLGFSAIMLVIGAWLARDSYRMLRRRSFEGIKSLSGWLAFTFFGSIVPWLEVLENRFRDEEGRVRHYVTFATAIAAFAATALVYSICVKLLNRLLKAASDPEEPPDTPVPAAE